MHVSGRRRHTAAAEGSVLSRLSGGTADHAQWRLRIDFRVPEMRRDPDGANEAHANRTLSVGWAPDRTRNRAAAWGDEDAPTLSNASHTRERERPHGVTFHSDTSISPRSKCHQRMASILRDSIVVPPKRAFCVSKYCTDLRSRVLMACTLTSLNPAWNTRSETRWARSCSRKAGRGSSARMNRLR